MIIRQLLCHFKKIDAFLILVLCSLLPMTYLSVQKIDSISSVSFQNHRPTKGLLQLLLNASKSRSNLINFRTLQSLDGTGTCASVELNSSSKSFTSNGRRHGKKQYRIQHDIRSRTGGHLCKVHLIPDNSFLERYENNKARAIKAAFSLFVSVNQIFLSETFGAHQGIPIYHGYGNILSSITFDNNRLFNNSESVWSLEDLANRLLNQLHLYYNSTSECLTYLLTNKNIIDSHGTEYNGFAYNETICDSGLNVGVVSTHLCASAINDSHCIRTMAHEFGHSWGAQHDTQVSRSIGGDYLMSDRLEWLRPNNLKFSRQSNAKIASVIDEIDPNCLVERDRSHCGNSLVEDNEQCDSGGASTCCTDECKFESNAECSPFNEESCSDLCRLITKQPEIDGILSKFYHFVLDYCIIFMFVLFIMLSIALYISYCLCTKEQMATTSIAIESTDLLSSSAEDSNQSRSTRKGIIVNLVESMPSVILNNILKKFHMSKEALAKLRFHNVNDRPRTDLIFQVMRDIEGNMNNSGIIAFSAGSSKSESTWL